MYNRDIMTLRQYADKLGIHYRTAWNHFKRGLIPRAYQLPTGTIIVPDSALHKSEHIKELEKDDS